MTDDNPAQDPDSGAYHPVENDEIGSLKLPSEALETRVDDPLGILNRQHVDNAKENPLSSANPFKGLRARGQPPARIGSRSWLRFRFREACHGRLEPASRGRHPGRRDV